MTGAHHLDSPQPPYLVGQFLLSMPGIGDPRFERAVIAMCVHDSDGALGIMVNQPITGLDAHGLLAQLEIDAGVTPRAPVFGGGPVEPGRGFVLHSPEYAGQSTIAVSSGSGPLRWGLTSTLDVLNDIAAGRGPQHWLMALGYTGWGAGQLDGEMLRHGWLAAPADTALLWQTPADQRWAAAFAGIGINAGQLSASVGRA
jgi:putative transcriptional regulator